MSRTTKRVLICEDNLALNSVVRINLERAGYQVATAYNGQEGWQILQQQEINLVITDEQMPQLSGRELCRRMRESPQHADIPVIMFTAKNLELDQDALRSELGIAETFPKPFSPTKLVEGARRVLEHRKALV